MKLFHDMCKYLSRVTTIEELYLYLLLSTTIVLLFFFCVKKFGTFIFRKKLSGRKEFVFNQMFKVVVNVMQILVLLFIWDDYIRDLMNLISVVSAAMTIALRELILNFFCGLYIQMKKPFKVEDRIEIDGIKGDVMNISSLDFEVLEISTKDERGQSTGIVVTFPNSVVFSKPIKNITKGFKYIWDEITVNVKLDCDLSSNKQTLYKIVNELEVVKNIPRKMKEQINSINTENRIYFNQYNPIIYTKLVDNHVELTIRYLMHPKKSRFVESVIWNKIYLAYKDGSLDLFTGTD